MNRQLELPGFPRAQYAPLQQQQERQQRQPAPLRGSSGYDTARTLCYLGLGVTALALSIAVLSSVDAVHQDVALLLQQQGVVLAANPGNPANPANPVASAALLPTERFGAAAAPALAARGALEGALPPRFVSVASGPLPADLFEAAIAQTVRPALEAPNGLLGGCFARNSSHETCLLVALPAAANGSLVALLAAEREPHPLDALRVLTVPRDPRRARAARLAAPRRRARRGLPRGTGRLRPRPLALLELPRAAQLPLRAALARTRRLPAALVRDRLPRLPPNAQLRRARGARGGARGRERLYLRDSRDFPRDRAGCERLFRLVDAALGAARGPALCRGEGRPLRTRGRCALPARVADCESPLELGECLLPTLLAAPILHNLEARTAARTLLLRAPGLRFPSFLRPPAARAHGNNTAI